MNKHGWYEDSVLPPGCTNAIYCPRDFLYETGMRLDKQGCPSLFDHMRPRGRVRLHMLLLLLTRYSVCHRI